VSSEASSQQSRIFKGEGYMFNPNHIVYFTLILLALYLSHWIWRYHFQPYLIRHQLTPQLSTTQTHIQQTIESIYTFANSRSISLKTQRQHYHSTPEHFTYGEIDVLAFLLILKQIKLQTKPIIYDLGCGAGKAVLTFALTFDCEKVYGIELLPPLYEQCKIQYEALLASPLFKQHFPGKILPVEFIQGDLLNIEISDAHIIFINATAFRGALWDAITQKLLTLQPGSFVILTSHTLPSVFFKTIYAGKQLMSWGLNSLYIYEKI
jgi:hypothetical protein